MHKRIEEIRRECPGCAVHVLAEHENGDVLVLYVPPPADRELHGADDTKDWGVVAAPTLMLISAELSHAVN